MYLRVIQKARIAIENRVIEANKLVEIRRELSDYELGVYGNAKDNRDEYMRNLIDASLKFLYKPKDTKIASKLRVA